MHHMREESKWGEWRVKKKKKIRISLKGSFSLCKYVRRKLKNPPIGKSKFTSGP